MEFWTLILSAIGAFATLLVAAGTGYLVYKEWRAGRGDRLEVIPYNFSVSVVFRPPDIGVPFVAEFSCTDGGMLLNRDQFNGGEAHRERGEVGARLGADRLIIEMTKYERGGLYAQAYIQGPGYRYEKEEFGNALRFNSTRHWVVVTVRPVKGARGPRIKRKILTAERER